MTTASRPGMPASGATSPIRGASPHSRPDRHHHGPRRGSPGRLRRRADGARPGDRQAPADPALRPDPRLLPQGRPASRLALERPGLGRAPTSGLPPAGRHGARRRPRQSERGRPHPDVYDPTLNPLYRDVLAPYGAVALPCRVGDPDRKGKVEANVGHAKKTPLRGLRFESLAQAQAYLDRWETRWADTRIHGTTKRQVAAMFAEERPTLGPLPLEPFSLLPVRHTHPYISMAVSRSQPPTTARRPAGSAAASTSSGTPPRSGSSTRRPASSCGSISASRAWHRIADADRPARTPPKTLALLAAAKRAGPAISTVCDHIHRHDGAPGVRRILGILALARKHGPAVVEDAATAALECGSPTYRFLRRYLDRRPAAPLALRQVDPLIRQLTLYRDLIDRRTGDSS